MIADSFSIRLPGRNRIDFILAALVCLVGLLGTCSAVASKGPIKRDKNIVKSVGIRLASALEGNAVSKIGGRVIPAMAGFIASDAERVTAHANDPTGFKAVPGRCRAPSQADFYELGSIESPPDFLPGNYSLQLNILSCRNDKQADFLYYVDGQGFEDALTRKVGNPLADAAHVPQSKVGPLSALALKMNAPTATARYQRTGSHSLKAIRVRVKGSLAKISVSYF